MDFVNLHVHSHFSLLDGLARIDDLVDRAKALEMPALALTDHGSMYGTIEFYQKCRKAGLKPLIGVETYVAPNGRMSKQAWEDNDRFHLILLAKDHQGYKNLMKMVTLAHTEGYYYKPRVDFELLDKYHEGIIALSGCLAGQLCRSIVRKNADPEVVLKRYTDIFGPDFYIELQNHPNIPDQAIANEGLIKLARQHNVPMVATGDSHYGYPEDADAHDVLLCLQTKKEKKDKNRLCLLGEDFSFNDGSHLKNAFGLLVPEAISNTIKIAEQCNVEIEMGKNILPVYDLPEGVNDEDFLRQLCEEGFIKRYGPDGTTQEHRDRLAYELSIIFKSGYSSYFLIVQDFINWAKDQGIVVGPGRGSAAGSLVAYLTGITNIDPIKYDLLFERFLNPERVSMPDIDTDFADTRRDEVLRYVEEKYGKDCVSQIITFGTMAARVSIRDVGRVLGMPYAFCDKLAKLIPEKSDLKQAMDTVQEIKDLYTADDNARQILDIARKVEGVARHTSTHACGVVITKEPLDNYAPCQYASTDDKTLVTQYSLHPVEDLGLLKMDFLGLSNLTILETARNLVKQSRGLDIDLDTLPLDDEPSYKLLQVGNTTGVFQLESAGMKRYLRQLKPSNIEDIIAMVALYRPGPMDLIPDYIGGKHGTKKPKYLHPKLKPILEKTYGVAVYQEQLMKIGQELAGFSLGEADILRKAVGKKILKLLIEQKEKFVAGCLKNGVKQEIAEAVFEFIEPFAGYGFNRSHAACYAVIAYMTAYMKANFPAEFMAALLTSDQGNTERVAIEIEECRQMGLEVLPPDVSESMSRFSVIPSFDGTEFKTIRFGLLAIKNVGEHIVDVIVAERNANGPYTTLENFLERIQDKDLNKKSVESLIRSGAMDRFGERAVLYSNIDKMLAFSKSFAQEKAGNQGNLFGALPASMGAPKLRLDPAIPLPKGTELMWEKELLGLYISDHPLKSLGPILKHFVTPCATAKKLPEGQMVKVAGIVGTAKKIFTKKNDPMLFVRIEDLSDSLEIIVFPKILAETMRSWEPDTVIAVEGKISHKDDEAKLICNAVKVLNEQMLGAMKQYADQQEAMLAAQAPTEIEEGEAVVDGEGVSYDEVLGVIEDEAVISYDAAEATAIS